MGGPGRFIWDRKELLKHEIIFEDIIFYYQMGIGDYKLVTGFWFKGEKYQYLMNKLEVNDIKMTVFEYDQTPEDIAAEMTRQIITIIEIFDFETT